ncbi:helix-turn-helix domain-containing protein [Paenibacillus rhizoplanae]
MPGSARFRQSIAFIEEHLHEEIPLEQAAQAGYTSLMQLYRDFYSYTGHSVKEYIRKRRLSVALGMIRSTQRPLTEIAYACGYSSQQALCKYVKSATRLTPLAYQKVLPAISSPDSTVKPSGR